MLTFYGVVNGEIPIVDWTVPFIVVTLAVFDKVATMVIQQFFQASGIVRHYEAAAMRYTHSEENRSSNGPV